MSAIPVSWMIVPAAYFMCAAGLSAFSASAAAAPAAMTGKIMTVSGPIEPRAAGRTLMHEHLFIDARVRDDSDAGWRAFGAERPSTPQQLAIYNAPLSMELIGMVTMGRMLNRDNMVLNDEPVAIDEAKQFKRFGGGTLVDLTSIGLARDPGALQRVARESRLNIVMGTSWFKAQWADSDIDARSVEKLAERIVREITTGVDESGIRAGIIGEVVATNPRDTDERKILEASARASRATGAAISVHIGDRRKVHLEVLDTLAAAGADPKRVVLGNSNQIATDLPLLKQILARGAYIQFDMLGDVPHVGTEIDDHDVAVTIGELIKLGFLERILLSQDVHQKTDLKRYGGSGYSFILEFYVPYLRRLGIDAEQIETMLIANPQRLLTLVAPGAAT